MADAPASPRSARAPRPLALALPLLLMAAGALQTPAPWNRLWIAVPALGAAGYLANLHRWGAGWLVPAAAAGWMLSQPESLLVWGWVLVGGTASASLLGLARRAGAPGSKALWAMLPVLGLAVAFPSSSLYGGTVAGAAAAVEHLGEEMFRGYRGMGLEGGSLGELAQQIERVSAALAWTARHLLPTVLFAWVTLLVALSALLARRAARAVGRPLAPRAPFAHFRLPEGAVWMLLAGLALVAAQSPELQPAGINLTLCMALGYCLQGMAVMVFAMLVRGFAPGLIWILFLFVTFFALAALAVASTGLGVADVWLNLRRRVQQPGRGEGGA